MVTSIGECLSQYFPQGRIIVHKHSPMEVTNSPENFQQKMNYLIIGFGFIRTDIDDLLVLTKGYWTDHVQTLLLTLNKLKEKVPKYNIEKFFFEQTKM